MRRSGAPELDGYRFPALMEGLRAAQAWLLSRGKAAGLPDAGLTRVELVCEEILANIIMHAYPEGPGEIEIHAALMDRFFAVTITDGGVPFNPLQAPKPDTNRPIEERRPGGLGTHFVKASTDEITYSRSQDRNALTLKWTVPFPVGGSK